MGYSPWCCKESDRTEQMSTKWNALACWHYYKDGNDALNIITWFRWGFGVGVFFFVFFFFVFFLVFKIIYYSLYKKTDTVLYYCSKSSVSLLRDFFLEFLPS